MKKDDRRNIIIRHQNYYENKEDYLARETPLTIFVNDNEFVTLVCTPDNLRELVLGFLLSEGLITDLSDIDDLTIIDGGFANVKLKTSLITPNNFLKRNLASCCGRGRAALYFINDAKQVRAVDSNLLLFFNGDILMNVIFDLEKKAELFNLTGGAHYAALLESEILCFFEDIGRHNAVDKVMGWSILEKIDRDNKVLALSGRVSSEIVVKAARGGIPLIISKAAPTDLAVDLAQELNITLIGFARGSKMNIYTHFERLKFIK